MGSLDSSRSGQNNLDKLICNTVTKVARHNAPNQQKSSFDSALFLTVLSLHAAPDSVESSQNHKMLMSCGRSTPSKIVWSLRIELSRRFDPENLMTLCL